MLLFWLKAIDNTPLGPPEVALLMPYTTDSNIVCAPSFLTSHQCVCLLVCVWVCVPGMEFPGVNIVFYFWSLTQAYCSLCTQVLFKEQSEHGDTGSWWTEIWTDQRGPHQSSAAEHDRSGITVDVRRFQSVQRHRANRVYWWPI